MGFQDEAKKRLNFVNFNNPDWQKREPFSINRIVVSYKIPIEVARKISNEHTVFSEKLVDLLLSSHREYLEMLLGQQ